MGGDPRQHKDHFAWESLEMAGMRPSKALVVVVPPRAFAALRNSYASNTLGILVTDIGKGMSKHTPKIPPGS